MTSPSDPRSGGVAPTGAATGAVLAAEPSLSAPGPARGLAGPAEEAPARFRPSVSVLSALGLALGAALAWAVLTVVTDHELGPAAIAVGLLAGAGAATGGRTRRAQLVGGSAAIVGYFAGRLLPVVLVAVQQPASARHALGVLGIVLVEMVVQTLTSVELAYLGAAAVAGYAVPHPPRAPSPASTKGR